MPSPSSVRRTMLKELAWTTMRAEEADCGEDLRKTLEQQIAAMRWLLEKTGLYCEQRLAVYLEQARATRAA